jgi:hypothetical protein
LPYFLGASQANFFLRVAIMRRWSAICWWSTTPRREPQRCTVSKKTRLLGPVGLAGINSCHGLRRSSGSLAMFARNAPRLGEPFQPGPPFSLTISQSRATLQSGFGELPPCRGEGVMRTPVAGWLALIVMLGLFLLVWTSGRPPCAPFILWHSFQMNCR